MFEPGQLVECIDADFGKDRSPLVEGRIYVVSKYTENGLLCNAGKYFGERAGVWLSEPDNPHSIDGCFAPARFRTLPDERLDIFRKALEPTPEQLEAYGVECLEEAEKDVEEALRAIDWLGVGSA